MPESASIAPVEKPADPEALADVRQPKFLTLSQIHELDRLRKPGRGMGSAEALAATRERRIWAVSLVLVLFGAVILARFSELAPAWERIAGAAPRVGNEVSGLWNGGNTDRAAVLVIDREPANQLVARNTLERDGYTVLIAANGEEAAGVLARRSGRVFLVIATTAIIDGETVQALRRIDPQARIVAAGRANRRWAADAVIRRPYQPAELLTQAHRLQLAATTPRAFWRPVVSEGSAAD